MNLICKITDKDINEEYHELDNPKLRLAARGLVIKDDGKIAIFNKSLKNEYKLPGGGMENDENPEEAFKREVLEETGCIVEIVKFLGTTEEYKCQENFKQISNVFIGKVVEDTKQFNFTQKEKDEGARLMWVSPEEGLKLITECYEQLEASSYESIYTTKFVVLRDRKILDYYINNQD